MQPKKSIGAGKSDGPVKPEQTSADSQGAALRRRINMQMVQNVLLIWLDNNINDNSPDCRNTIAQLRCVVNSINTFTDADECIAFLQSMGDEKACMIVSDSFGKHILPRIHNMSQVDSIFIFCNNEEYREQWIKEWAKIKGVFSEISPICDALKQAAQQCEQNTISISFIAPSNDNSKTSLDHLDQSFMYTQIVKEILLAIQFDENHIAEFIEYCLDVFADSESELRNVKRFQRKYHDETPIWWYTCECFLYPMLNRTLRLMDMDIMIRIGFFIDDLHRHIEQLHKEQFGDNHSDKTFIVYRGQGMSKSEFEQMSKSKGGLISFNNFLSTSKDRTVSLGFAHRAVKNPDLVGILFVMTIDPGQSTTPFACITDVSYYKDKEDEVLFAMHTVFRICEIKSLGENQRLFQVELTLTSDNDNDLRQLTDHIREETYPNSSGWYRLGLVLIQMGQFDKAEEVYQILLDQATDERVKAPIYVQLGSIKYNQGEYKEAITFCEKSLEIKGKTLPPNHPDLAVSYNNIGGMYGQMGEYAKALPYFEKALEIIQQSLPPNDPKLGSSYANIGVLYEKMGDYSKALSSHEKALTIRQQSLPPNHPHLSYSCNNIGSVYFQMDEHSKALSYFEKALKIDQQSLPPNHPDLAMSYSNIGSLYGQIGEYAKALPYLEKALEIRQQSLASNHPDLVTSYDNIGVLYEKMSDYSKARSFYERALDIGQQSLPSNHPELQKCRGNLDRIKNKL